VYAVVALLILLPLLGRGYILTLDMVFTPHIRWPVGGTNSYPFWVLLHYLNQLLPSDVIQKLLLFTIFLLAGVGMHRLVRNIDVRCKQTAGQYTLGAFVAGTLYMVNPFTYERLMAGQYAVLFGYALLPWLARALLIFLERPAADQRDAVDALVNGSWNRIRPCIRHGVAASGYTDMVGALAPARARRIPAAVGAL